MAVRADIFQICICSFGDACWEAGASFVRAADEAIRHAAFEIEVAFCYIDRIGFDAHAFKRHGK